MPDGAKRMSGRICLVTGATSGIGAATALVLAREGATVVGVGRDPKRCAASAQRIARATGSSVGFLLADLSAQEEIRDLAREFQSRYPRLDVLVNCAGARFDERRLSRDGYEMTFALNHLSYFLLTMLLFEQMSGGGRIINVASAAHASCPGVDFDDLQGERGYCGKKAYAQSKLANLLFSCELDRRLAGTGVTVNAASPGNVLSRFARNNGILSWARHIAGSLKSGALVTPVKGAETVVFLACSPEMEGVSGGYFANCREARRSDPSRDLSAAEHLWEVSLALTRIRGSRRKEEAS